MREYVKTLRDRLGSSQAFADFVGVSVHTVNAWTMGKNKPTDASFRMIEVLGMVAADAPHVFDALISNYVVKRQPILRALPLADVAPVKAKMTPLEHVRLYNEMRAKQDAAQPAPFGRAQLTPEQIAERDARNAAYWAAVDAGEQPELIEQAPVVPFVPHVKTIAGRTLDQWQVEWDDPESEAFDALSLDDNDRVLAWLGK